LNRPKWWGLLGIARKSRRLIWGIEKAMQAVSNRREGGLLIIAGDASCRSKIRLEREALKNGVKTVVVGDKEALGTAAGLPPVAALYCFDNNLAAAIAASVENDD